MLLYCSSYKGHCQIGYGGWRSEYKGARKGSGAYQKAATVTLISYSISLSTGILLFTAQMGQQ